MGFKKTLVKMMAALVAVNFTLTITACGYFNQVKGLQETAATETKKLFNLVSSAGLTEGERGQIQGAINHLNKFLKTWAYLPGQAVIDDGVIDRFDADFKTLLAEYDLSRSIVQRHKSEYTPEQWAEIAQFNHKLEGIRAEIESMRGDALDFVQRRELAVKLVNQAATIYKILNAQ